MQCSPGESLKVGIGELRGLCEIYVRANASLAGMMLESQSSKRIASFDKPPSLNGPKCRNFRQKTGQQELDRRSNDLHFA
jgi:hypothetical protein